MFGADATARSYATPRIAMWGVRPRAMNNTIGAAAEITRSGIRVGIDLESDLCGEDDGESHFPVRDSFGQTGARP